MRRTILVVDDNADTNDALVRLLTLRGYDAHAAFDGAEAVTCLIDGLNPCLIVLDLRMPVVDGHAFLRAIGSDARLARIPVIVYSALREPVTSDAVLAYVDKGRDPDTLLDLIRACWPVAES